MFYKIVSDEQMQLTPTAKCISISITRADRSCAILEPSTSKSTVDKNMFSDDSSDDENMQYLLASGIIPFIISTSDAQVKHPGSQKGKAANVPREFSEALQRLNRDYFGSSPKYYAL